VKEKESDATAKDSDKGSTDNKDNK
jgi:hypothetical protein